jgi:hypothetical protein
VCALAARAPYFHNGSATTPEEVIEFLPECCPGWQDFDWKLLLGYGREAAEQFVHTNSQEIRDRRRQQRQEWDALHDGQSNACTGYETPDDVTDEENPTATTGTHDARVSRK